jgi:hypothetical protein
MSAFQKEVRATFRTQAEIDEEKQGRIVVHPTATRTSTECFPCLAIEVLRDGVRPQRTWVDLRKLGTQFASLDAALEIAKTVKVISVDAEGEVQWTMNSQAREAAQFLSPCLNADDSPYKSSPTKDAVIGH